MTGQNLLGNGVGQKDFSHLQKSHDPVILRVRKSHDPVVLLDKKSHDPVVFGVQKSHDPVVFWVKKVMTPFFLENLAFSFTAFSAKNIAF